MLVISRKVGESFLISDDVKVSILSVSGDKISIGIAAPADVRITRAELVETIAENKNASNQIDETDMHRIASLIKEKNRT